MRHGFPADPWRKSSRSSNSGGQCVEVTVLSERIGVRDSKNPDATHLTFTPSRFAPSPSGPAPSGDVRVADGHGRRCGCGPRRLR
ncbi:DUF397 domain-containing protein [Actinocorallia libanotica]|uniref:DUF397 domain-containing protein n=1 Tax=Actinocorallia libanotica TaxID=46162 RepID=UPI0031DB1AC1